MICLHIGFPVRKEYKKSIFSGCGPPVAPAESTVRCSAVSGCLVRCLPGHALPDGSAHTTLLCSAGQRSIRLTHASEQRPNPKKNMVYGTPMTELTITSRYVHSRVESNTFTMGKPMPESTLKVHKIENFFGFDFEICTFS